MNEYAFEPVPGLPEALPAGEQIRWQGSPDWKALARDAFHVRLVAAYFAILAGWSLATGAMTGAIITLIAGSAGVGLLAGLALLSSRSTIYTITDRRVVMRFGIALPKCINLPMVRIAAADLAVRPDGIGDIPLRLSGTHRLGWLALWPHARPWRIGAPEPMLRAVPEAARVADLLTGLLVEVVSDGRRVPIDVSGFAPAGSVAA